MLSVRQEQIYQLKLVEKKQVFIASFLYISMMYWYGVSLAFFLFLCISAFFRSLGNFKGEMEALISFYIWNTKKVQILFWNIDMIVFFLYSFLWSTNLIDLFISSIETGIKQNVLPKQLFLDAIRFMIGWYLYL